MSTTLIEEQRVEKPQPFYVPHTVIDRMERRKPIPTYSLPPVADDEEMKFVTRAVIWMAVLAVIPLTLFYIITYFYPEIFLIPITPN